MRLSSRASVADRLSVLPSADGPLPSLRDGSRIAVVGSGPAGSFFSFFALKMAGSIDLDLDLEIYEPRSFRHCGPAGCNHCGGIVSESLVQILAAEGINLPPEVVQRGIDSYVVHMDVGSVRIRSPAGEERIAALYRGNGPREGANTRWRSFDGFLQDLAVERGARVVRRLITQVDEGPGGLTLTSADGTSATYDLVAVATGVNSNFLTLLDRLPTPYRPPDTTRTYICEFRSTPDEVFRMLGNSMHVFLLPIPRLEFAAIIPKGEFITVVMLGDELDQELVHAFLEDPAVRRCFPTNAVPCVCSCAPLINMGPTRRPYADRLVMIGDSGVTRLYKDGIGAAFRTAKSAASTAVFEGISSDAFERHYWPTCRRIMNDNAIGRVIFGTTTLFKYARFSRSGILRMAAREQRDPDARAHMSSLLWNMFTGSAPYREILLGTLHPGFLGNIVVNLAAGLLPTHAKDG